jgi:hypothetical protein
MSQVWSGSAVWIIILDLLQCLLLLQALIKFDNFVGHLINDWDGHTPNSMYFSKFRGLQLLVLLPLWWVKQGTATEPLYICNTFSLSYHWLLDWLPSLAIGKNCAAIKKWECRNLYCMWNHFLWSGITWQYESSIFIFLRNLYTDFHSGWLKDSA